MGRKYQGCHEHVSRANEPITVHKLLFISDKKMPIPGAWAFMWITFMWIVLCIPEFVLSSSFLVIDRHSLEKFSFF